MKTIIKTLAGLLITITLSACAAPPSATRSAMPEAPIMGRAQTDVSIDSFTVSVPRSLEVSERNLYYPRGDIVWRGDPIGDRHAQVQAIVKASLRNAAPRIKGTRPVRMDVQITRFHALSEKARYSVGGVHDIDFKYRLIDVQTGRQIAPTKDVSADLQGLAGQAAIASNARGVTQKSRIIAHLTRVFIDELTTPHGHQNADLGLLQAINEL
jgi:hypothetical protein